MGPVPLLQRGDSMWGGSTQRPLHLARPSELRWRRDGDQGGPSAPAETLGQPPQARGPQSRSWCPPGGPLRGRSGCPRPGSSPGSAPSRLGHQGWDLRLCASVSLPVKWVGWVGDGCTDPSRSLHTAGAQSNGIAGSLRPLWCPRPHVVPECPHRGLGDLRPAAPHPPALPLPPAPGSGQTQERG